VRASEAYFVFVYLALSSYGHAELKHVNSINSHVTHTLAPALSLVIIYICMYVCMYVCMCVCVCVCVYIYMYIYIYIYIHTYIHTYMCVQVKILRASPLCY
jgi:hypothetical protein